MLESSPTAIFLAQMTPFSTRRGGEGLQQAMTELALSSRVSSPGSFNVPQIAGRLCSEISQLTIASFPPCFTELG